MSRAPINVVRFPGAAAGASPDFAQAAELVNRVTGTATAGFGLASQFQQQANQLAGAQSRARQSELQVRGARLAQQAEAQRLELAKMNLGNERLERLYEDIYELQHFDLAGRLAQGGPEEIARLTSQYPFLNQKLRGEFQRMAQRSLSIDMETRVYHKANEQRQKELQEGRAPKDFNYIGELDRMLAQLEANDGLSPEAKLGVRSTLIPQLRARMQAEWDRKAARQQAMRETDAMGDFGYSVAAYLRSTSPGDYETLEGDLKAATAISTIPGQGPESTDTLLASTIISSLPKIVHEVTDPRSVLDRIEELKDTRPEVYKRVKPIAEQEVQQAFTQKQNKWVDNAIDSMEAEINRNNFEAAAEIANQLLRPATAEERARFNIPEGETRRIPVAADGKVRLAISKLEKAAAEWEQKNAGKNLVRDVLENGLDARDHPVNPGDIDAAMDAMQNGDPLGAPGGISGAARTGRRYSEKELWVAAARSGITMPDVRNERLHEKLTAGTQSDYLGGLDILRGIESEVGPVRAEGMLANVKDSKYLLGVGRVLKGYSLNDPYARKVADALGTVEGQTAYNLSEGMLYGAYDKDGKQAAPPTVSHSKLLRGIFPRNPPGEMKFAEAPTSDFQKDLQATMGVEYALAMHDPGLRERSSEEIQKEVVDRSMQKMRGKYITITLPDGTVRVVPNEFPNATFEVERPFGERMFLRFAAAAGRAVPAPGSLATKPAHGLQGAIDAYAQRRQSLVDRETASEMRRESSFGLRMQTPITHIVGAPRPEWVPNMLARADLAQDQPTPLRVGTPMQAAGLVPGETEAERKARVSKRRTIQFMPDVVGGAPALWFGYDPHSPGKDKFIVMQPLRPDQLAMLERANPAVLSDEERNKLAMHHTFEALTQQWEQMHGTRAFREDPELDYPGNWGSAEQYARFGMGGEDFIIKLDRKAVRMTEAQLGTAVDPHNPRHDAMLTRNRMLILEQHDWPRADMTDEERSLHHLPVAGEPVALLADDFDNNTDEPIAPTRQAARSSMTPREDLLRLRPKTNIA